MSASINALPNEILLSILQYLSIVQLYQIRRVCQRWRTLIQDKLLFSVLNIPAERVPAIKLRHLAKKLFGEHVQAIHIPPCFNVSLTPVFFRELARCTQLQVLTVDGVGMRGKLFGPLPTTLKVLHVKNCHCTVHGGAGLSFRLDSRYSALEELNLSFSKLKYVRDALVPISELPSLRRLNLAGCSGLTDFFGNVSAFSHITHLDSSRCKFTRQHLQHMSRVLVNLQTLILRDITIVNDDMKTVPANHRKEACLLAWITLWSDGFPSLERLSWSLTAGSKQQTEWLVDSLPVDTVKSELSRIKHYSDSKTTFGSWPENYPS